MSVQILLPNERAEQLKRFANSQNVPIAEAVGLLIDEAIQAGKLPDELPGFAFKRDGDHVTMDTGVWTRTLTRELARSYAAQIRAIAKPAITLAVDNPFFPEMPVSALRRGAGVKLIDRDSAAARTVSPGVASDVARRIEQVAQ